MYRIQCISIENETFPALDIKEKGNTFMHILPLRVALAQINVTVGDLEGNTQKILTAMQQASQAGAHIVCTAELALTGYPPEDLLLKPGFVDANLAPWRS